jgi:hypothetical protein
MTMSKKTVVQIVFDEDTTESDILEALRTLGQGIAYDTCQMKKFDPEHGGPVIYFP